MVKTIRKTTTIGVISDTHGLVRPEALEFLLGSDLIIHAGDIGKPEVLETLGTVAPVFAVRGNNDHGSWAEEIPATEVIEVGSQFLYVVHELDHLDFDPAGGEFSAIIYGHSHRPLAERRDGVLFLNPGSAGPRRFRLPVALARLRVHGTKLESEIVELQV